MSGRAVAWTVSAKGGPGDGPAFSSLAPWTRDIMLRLRGAVTACSKSEYRRRIEALVCPAREVMGDEWPEEDSDPHEPFDPWHEAIRRLVRVRAKREAADVLEVCSAVTAMHRVALALLEEGRSHATVAAAWAHGRGRSSLKRRPVLHLVRLLSEADPGPLPVASPSSKATMARRDGAVAPERGPRADGEAPPSSPGDSGLSLLRAVARERGAAGEGRAPRPASSKRARTPPPRRPEPAPLRTTPRSPLRTSATAPRKRLRVALTRACLQPLMAYTALIALERLCGAVDDGAAWTWAPCRVCGGAPRQSPPAADASPGGAPNGAPTGASAAVGEAPAPEAVVGELLADGGTSLLAACVSLSRTWHAVRDAVGAICEAGVAAETPGSAREDRTAGTLCVDTARDAAARLLLWLCKAAKRSDPRAWHDRVAQLRTKSVVSRLVDSLGQELRSYIAPRGGHGPRTRGRISFRAPPPAQEPAQAQAETGRGGGKAPGRPWYGDIPEAPEASTPEPAPAPAAKPRVCATCVATWPRRSGAGQCAAEALERLGPAAGESWRRKARRRRLEAELARRRQQVREALPSLDHLRCSATLHQLRVLALVTAPAVDAKRAWAVAPRTLRATTRAARNTVACPPVQYYALKLFQRAVGEMGRPLTSVELLGPTVEHVRVRPGEDWLCCPSRG